MMLLSYVLYSTIIHQTNSEIYVNEKPVTCGMTEDCMIQCNALKSCQHAVFHVYNNSITILCSDLQSCQYADIYTHNVRSLHLIITGTSAFSSGFLITASNDQNITVECLGQNACTGARFSYRQQGIASHLCGDTDTTTRQYGCAGTVIHATTAVSVHCDSLLYQKACKELKIIMPFNETQHQLSSFKVTGSVPMTHGLPVVIYSLYETNIICDSCSLDNVYVVHGMQFREYCELSDTECVENIAFLQNADDFLYVDNMLSSMPFDGVFPSDLDFSAFSSNKHVVFILEAYEMTFIPPILTNDTKYITVLCMYCRSMHLDFYSVQNAALSAVRPSWGMYETTVIGPQSSFVYNAFAETTGNTLYLNHSIDEIIINSAYASDIWLAHNIKVQLDCGGIGYGCYGTNVYSALDPLVVYPLQDLGFTIDCPVSKAICTGSGCAARYNCDGFGIWFADDKYCEYESNDNTGYECNFLTKSPTSAPTLSPTKAPSAAPTKPPSAAPSFAPSAAPSDAPSTSPSAAPTEIPTIQSFAPTFAPSIAPTNSPTQPPTAAPSISPTMFPSHSPTNRFTTKAPSSTPSFSPTNNPTITPSNAPTNAPSLTPSIAPTSTPSIAPSDVPSIAPSLSPSYSPSHAPSNIPSVAPSDAPSNAPTRIPTVSDAYSYALNAEYVINNITNEYIPKQVRAKEADEKLIDRMQAALEFAYNYVSDEFAALFQDKTEFVQYKDFQVKIEDVAMEGNNSSLRILSDIYYEENAVGTKLAFISSKATFKERAQNAFRREFDDEYMTFEIISVEQQRETESISKSFDYVLYSLLSFMVIMCMGSVAALIFNKLPQTKIDDADWFILIVFGLQVFDFVSDINLSIEMISEFDGKLFELNALYIAGYMSIVFVVLPYVINISIAANIKHFVSKNTAAASYFEQRAALFVTLVVFTGSAYPALCLLSSRLFCLEVFSSGLTKYETRNLIIIKIVGSVLLENIWQLVAQVLYIYYSGGIPSENTVLSFGASLLSVIAAILSYFVHCQSSDCYVVEYDLKMSKKTDLSTEDESKILNNKEKKKALKGALCPCIGVHQTDIEIGVARPTSNGVVFHIIHFFLKNQIDALNVKQFESKIITLYSNKQTQVNHAFRRHFGLSSEFKVKYDKQFDNFKRATIGSSRDIELEECYDTNHDSLTVIEALISRISASLREQKNERIIYNELLDDGFHQDKILMAFTLFDVNVTNNVIQHCTDEIGGEIQHMMDHEYDDAEGILESVKSLIRSISTNKYRTVSGVEDNVLDDVGELQMLSGSGQTSTAV